MPLAGNPVFQYLQSARVREIATGEVHFSLEQRATAVLFSPDGESIVTASGGHVWLWDVASRQVRQKYPEVSPVGGPRAIALSADGTRLAASWERWDETGIRIWALPVQP